MKCYFSTYYIKLGLIVAIFFSLEIYLIHFEIDNKLLNSVLLIVGFWLIYKNDIKITPWIGFFMSIFWLWWISLSFRYYNLSYLIPLIILGIAIFYFILFYIVSLFNSKIVVVLFIIFGIGYIRPFGFDWFDFKFLLPHTYFFLPNSPPKPAKLKIKVINTHISQNIKWQKSFIPIEIQNNLKIIKNLKNYDIVILPESVFPIALNLSNDILDKLKVLSKNKTIIVGALEYKDRLFYNSTYVFENGKYKVYNKHLLVPFGEYIPIHCCKNLLNRIFFNGANDYTPAKNFATYTIKGIEFSNAICYEATNYQLYKQTPKYIIAMSNNAWFKPSIEITLQKMIIEYYSNIYQKYVYHSINY
jgi:apolipoprotein N-acyltransferase